MTSVRAQTTNVPSFLTAQPFAHRGLHGDGVIENSIAAFDRAIAAGHGIELDVQLTLDGDVIVFHDTTLDRLTERTGPVASLSRAQLENVRLRGTSETLHTLHAVLHYINGRVPVLIEVKTPTAAHLPLCFAVRRALEGYRGPMAVMSFNPNLVRWFARHSSRIVRGLVVTDESRNTGRLSTLRRRVEQIVSMARARPQFLAYDIRSLPSAMSQTARQKGLPVLTWTVRSDSERAHAALHADQIIYETTSRTERA